MLNLIQQKENKCIVCSADLKIKCNNCGETLYCSEEHRDFDQIIHKLTCKVQYMQSKSIKSPQSKLLNQEIFPITQSLLLNTQKIDQFLYKGNVQSELIIQNNKQQQYSPEKSSYKIRVQRIKNMIELRKSLRNNIIYLYLSKKFDNSIVQAKKLSILSSKIFSDFDSSKVQDYLVYWHNIKTNRFLQELQMLMDLCMICKIYQIINKKEEIKKLIMYYSFPKYRSYQDNLITKSKREINSLNVWKQQITRYNSLLKTLIIICTAVNLLQIAQNLYIKQITLIKQTSGPLELSSSYFEFGNWYMSNKLMQKAKRVFLICKQLREKYGETLPLASVYYNLGLVQYFRNKQNKKSCIESIQKSLQIKRDKYQRDKYQREKQITLELQTLGKIYMEEAQFQMSFNKLFQCFLIRKNKLISNHKDKVRIEVLIISLYRNIKRNLENEAISNQKKNILIDLLKKIKVKVFSLPDFIHYQIEDDPAIFQLNIDQSFFNDLRPDQIILLSKVIDTLNTLTYRRGLKYLKQSELISCLSKVQLSELEKLNGIELNKIE